MPTPFTTAGRWLQARVPRAPAPVGAQRGQAWPRMQATIRPPVFADSGGLADTNPGPQVASSYDANGNITATGDGAYGEAGQRLFNTRRRYLGATSAATQARGGVLSAQERELQARENAS